MRKSVLLIAHRTIVSPTLRDFLTRRRDFAPASSRWLATALPRRIEKLTGALVTEIHSTNRMAPPPARRPAERYVS